MGFESISNRISRWRIKGHFYNTNIINAYTPTEITDQEETEQFYATLYQNMIHNITGRF